MWLRITILFSFAILCLILMTAEEMPLNEKNYGDEEAAKKITAQTFRYLGSGGQTDVFVSEDDVYVLKLFKNHPRKWIPFPNYRQKKLFKLRRDIQGYQLAATTIPQESGLVFCHLKKTPFGKTTVHTASGKVRTLNLDNVEFIVQRKAVPIEDYFAHHPSQETLECMKKLLKLLAERQLEDHDPRLHKNIGILEGKAILMDPGRLAQAWGAKTAFSPKFLDWLKNNYPDFEAE
jgi:hypothetical protein